MGTKSDLYRGEAEDYAKDITKELCESEDFKRGVLEGYISAAMKYDTPENWSSMRVSQLLFKLGKEIKKDLIL